MVRAAEAVARKDRVRIGGEVPIGEEEEFDQREIDLAGFRRRRLLFGGLDWALHHSLPGIFGIPQTCGLEPEKTLIFQPVFRTCRRTSADHVKITSALLT